MKYFAVVSRGGADVVAVVRAADGRAAFRLKTARKLPDANFGVTEINEAEYHTHLLGKTYPAFTNADGELTKLRR